MTRGPLSSASSGSRLSQIAANSEAKTILSALMSLTATVTMSSPVGRLTSRGSGAGSALAEGAGAAAAASGARWTAVTKALRMDSWTVS